MPYSITIVCNNYPPEFGAASLRLSKMAQALSQHGYKVSVLTLQPNYPKGRFYKDYPKFKIERKVENDLCVYRMPYWPSASAHLLKRGFSQLSHAGILRYALQKVIKYEKSDVLLINTPNFYNAIVGTQVAKKYKLPTILNVSDLYPQTAIELGALKKASIIRYFQKKEKEIYDYAHAIIGQSTAIIEHIQSITQFNNKPHFLYRNLPNIHINRISDTPIRNAIVYAGLLGTAQNLLDIIKSYKQLNTSVELHIFGEGNQKAAIIDAIKDCQQIVYKGVLPESDLHQTLLSYKAFLIPLTKDITGAFPSKIYVATALGIPILGLGLGKIGDFINEHDLGWSTHSVNDDWPKILDKLQHLSPDDMHEKRKQMQAFHRKYFDYSKQASAFLQFIDDCTSGLN